ncbi:cysteine-rich and transmembrane domain-containing protein WIH1-like [Juglans microcarpa x Juglans regia]|uniref:cysteine-rich and transmembrane domain-containing protein WIH1-like n=1 Tax=Juglans microcarpa x Juglans regia TaxID=2249226 RepID=UPI001B7D9241|nr:cysteine-rich and transmembrane domain-containing protein WIH1-like [Juglans microcarpa x Juglans regia]
MSFQHISHESHLPSGQPSPYPSEPGLQPPPPSYPHPSPPPQGYQGYFHDGHPPPSRPYQRYDGSGCPSFLRGCLAALCCCWALEQCCP